MKKLTVLYICNEAGLGGAAQSLINMLQEIRRYISPIVIIPGRGIIEKRLKELQVKYYSIPFVLAYDKIGKADQQTENRVLINNYEAALQIASIVNEESVDLVHTNSSVGNVGAMAAIMTGRPHVWHIRELLEEDFNSEFFNKELKMKLLQQAECLITISDCVKRKYYQRYKLNSAFIYDGLDIERYISSRKYPVENRIFLLAGEIRVEKGQFEAVKAVEILRNWGIDNFKLIIVGGGKQKYIWTLKKYIKKNMLQQYIKVLPFCDNLTELRQSVLSSLTCSRMEALGRVTIEAMLAGNVVIGSDTGGTLELIGADQTRGYLYKQGDSQELAKVMKKVLEDAAGKNKACIKAAQQFAISQFDLMAYVKKICDIYNSVIMREDAEQKTVRGREILKELEHQYKELKSYTPVLSKEERDNNKIRRIFQCDEQWLHIRQDNHTLTEFFVKNNIKTIAIYGMGYLGRNLYDELENSEIEVLYVIDQNPENIEKVISVADPEAEWKAVDAVVITVIDEEERLKKYVQETHSLKALGLKEILYDFNV